MKLITTPHQPNGYAALATVLVIAAVVLVIGLSVTALSVNDIQTSLSTKKADEARYLVESCIEDALLELNESGSIPAIVTVNGASCSVTINVQVGNTWTFTTQATVDGATKAIEVEANRGSLVTVSEWIEV